MCRNATDFLCIDFVSCNFPEFVNSNSFLMESLGFSIYNMGLSCGSEGREIACHAGDLDSIPGSGKSPGEGDPVFSPGEAHGQRSLAGYSPWVTRVGHSL